MAGALPLHTAQPVPSGKVATCAELLEPAVLRGSPVDGRVAWLQTLDARRIEIIWPAGFSARFEPMLEVLDATGTEVLRDGDFVDGACEMGDLGGRLMEPPFLAFQVDCGPLAIEDCASGRLREVATTNGWPSREIESIQFLDANGRYRIRFENGTQSEGTSTAP